jgi:hypothetical protein
MLAFWFLINSFFSNFTFNYLNLGLSLNIVFGFIFGFYYFKFFKFKIHNSYYYIFLFLTLYCAVSLFGNCEDKHLKSLLSTPIIFILSSIAAQIGMRASNSDWLWLEKASVLILICLCTGILIEFFNPIRFPNTEVYRISGKYSGFNSEPSVVACTIFPYILILLTSKKINYKYLGTIFFLFFLFFSRSSTLLIFTVVSFIFFTIMQYKNYKIFIYCIFIYCIFILIKFIVIENIITDDINNETYDRFIGILDYKNSVNLSSLAYIQGWQFAYTNFFDTYGVGLGLNMMGCQPLPEVTARGIINQLSYADMNTENGTFLFSKIISEFGLFGLIFYIYIFFKFVKLIFSTKEINNKFNIQIIIIFTFLISSFVRSPGGYFTADLFILIPALVSIASFRFEKYDKK